MVRTAPALRFIVMLVVALGAAACAKTKPVVVADGPALAMPLPPSRVFAPLEEPAPVQAPPPEVADAEPPKPAPRPPTPRRSPPAEAAKPDPEPPPVAAAPAPEPARELRAAPSAADATAERQVKDLLARASRDLNRVNYQRLSNEGRSQYDQAKRFAQQAEEALKERNFVFASTLADKAAMLASQLGG